MVRVDGMSEPRINTDGHGFCGLGLRDSDWRDSHRIVGMVC